MKYRLSLAVFFLGFSTFAQTNSSFDLGQRLYSQSDFTGARNVFQNILNTPSQSLIHGSSLLWLAKTEMALRSFDQASQALETFLSKYPRHPSYNEALYEKGRLFFYQDEFENSILILDEFLKTQPGPELGSNALFWMGEDSFQLGRWEESQVFFRRVIEFYPSSYKVEASRYRLSMIELKIREEELLRLLKWSHEEILNALDEFRRRERAYQQAIQAYQKRILELESGSDQSVRIRQLEEELRLARLNASPSGQRILSPATPATTQTQPTAAPNQTLLRSLQELRAQAEELKKIYDEWEAIHADGR